MNITKRFFDTYKNHLIESPQKLGTFLLNEIGLEVNEIENVIRKICSPSSIMQ